jgi:hypothetical protein
VLYPKLQGKLERRLFQGRLLARIWLPEEEA